MKKTLNVLSLGAGVQSSTLLLMANKGLLANKLDCAVFADTQFESKESYQYLEYLKSIVKIPIHTTTYGSITKDALDPTKSRFASMPLYTREITLANSLFGIVPMAGKIGMLKRQCTTHYKIEPVKKFILAHYGGNWRKLNIKMWIGISTDEISRVRTNTAQYIENTYPLIYELGLSRNKCVEWLHENKFRVPPKSSCLCCPFHSDEYWNYLKTVNPDEFEMVCKFDDAIRNSTSKGVKMPVYVHRKCIPLRDLDFPNYITNNEWKREYECTGFCHT